MGSFTCGCRSGFLLGSDGSCTGKTSIRYVYNVVELAVVISNPSSFSPIPTHTYMHAHTHTRTHTHTHTHTCTQILMNVPLMVVVVLTLAQTLLAPSSALVQMVSNWTRMASHAAVSHVLAIHCMTRKFGKC